MWAGQRAPSPTAPGLRMAAVSSCSHWCGEGKPTPSPLHTLVFLHPISPSHGSGCPCHPMTLGVLWCHQCRTGAEAQLSAGALQGSQPQPIPMWQLSQPANPVLPPGPSCLIAASTNHNQAPLWSDQSCGSTWHFPTTNHVLPLLSAAASPLAAAAHQSQHEGDCIEPIRSRCLPSVPASQGQPRPARSYKGPSALGLL